MDGLIGVSSFSLLVFVVLVAVKMFFGYETAALLGISVILVSVFITAYNSMTKVK
jgi:hypothetical protein